MSESENVPDIISENVPDTIKWKAHWNIYKFPKETDHNRLIERSKALSDKGLSIDDVRKMGFDPYAIEQIPANISLKVARNTIMTYIAKTAVASRLWTSSLAYLFVGTHSTAASYTQSGLLGASGSRAKYKMDTGYPTVSSNTATWRSTFTSLTANFAWKEYSLRSTNTQTSGKALNRVSLSKGTKASGETWTLQLTITLT